MRVRQIKARNENSKIRTAAYCRVSTLRDVQEGSLESQTRFFQEYIESDPTLEFVGIYADQKSGTTDERPEFQRMMDCAESSKIDRILCKSISRFSRNVPEALRYIEFLNSRQVNVVFLKENMDTAHGSSKIILHFLAAIAQHESQSISDNIRVSNRKRYENGDYSPGNQKCFGYTVAGGRLTPDGNADVVREIYSMFLSGRSYQDICDYLNANGIRNRRGREMKTAGIRYILQNEAYVGDKALLRHQRKGLFDNTIDGENMIYRKDDHGSVIDRTTWVKAQEKLQNLREGEDGMKQLRRGGKPHFLHGKLFCGECGALMTRRTLRSYRRKGEPAATYKAWTCYERHKGKAGNGCQCRNVREEEVLRALSANATGAQNDESIQMLAERIREIWIDRDDIRVIMK